MPTEASVSLGIWVLATATMLFGTLYAVRQFRRKPEPGKFPPVSVLKPLKGADAGLESNLRSFFLLDYPELELLFSVDSERDAAVPVVRRLLTQYPDVRAKLIVGAVYVGRNPKVNNLICSYEEAKHDTLVISDSNIRVPPTYLRRMVPQLTEHVGIVTAVVAGHEPEGWGGLLEAAYLNSFYARWMQLSRAVGHTCVVGKSMLFRREVLDRIGGLRALGRYVAEDYMAGRAVERLGFEVQIMPDPIHQHIGNHSFASYWSRHLRWGRIRKAQAPLAFAFEPLFGSLVSGVLGAYAAGSLWGVSFVSFLFLHSALWLAADLLLMRTLAVKIEFRTLLGWLVREASAFPQWCHVALGSRIEWRGTRLRILPGGMLA